MFVREMNIFYYLEFPSPFGEEVLERRTEELLAYKEILQFPSPFGEEVLERIKSCLTTLTTLTTFPSPVGEEVLESLGNIG